MTGYLTNRQLDQLIRGINPRRVSTDGKGFSHVEAYEVRAHLTRIFGFARWSEDVLSQDCIFESQRVDKTTGEVRDRWDVAYRSIVRLTVCAPDGTRLATWAEGAVGDAGNQPSRSDAHDLALKMSQSQALKRCAVNLGDQFGNSLYAKGSTAPLVKAVLWPETHEPVAATAVDAHITESLPAEDIPVDAADVIDSAVIDDMRDAARVLAAEKTTAVERPDPAVKWSRDSVRQMVDQVADLPPSERRQRVNDYMVQASQEKAGPMARAMLSNALQEAVRAEKEQVAS